MKTLEGIEGTVTIWIFSGESSIAKNQQPHNKKAQAVLAHTLEPRRMEIHP